MSLILPKNAYLQGMCIALSDDGSQKLKISKETQPKFVPSPTNQKFIPFNWHKAGLKSPIEYYLVASNSEHIFTNIIISKLEHNFFNNYCIYGKSIIGEIVYNFKVDITVYTSLNKDISNILYHEGDFILTDNNKYYRFQTTIDSTGIQYNESEHIVDLDPISKITFDLPRCVKKMALIIVEYDI